VSASERPRETLLGSKALRRLVGIVYGVVKRLSGIDRMGYRGLVNNAARSFVALGLAKCSSVRTNRQSRLRLGPQSARQ
jgi:hypothetical protein